MSSADSKQKYTAASLLTADNLRSIARSMSLQDVSHLSLPEVDAVVDVVSRMIPAGNVPGMILSGLGRLAGRRTPGNVVKRDINLIFRGVEQALDKAVYRTFFAGPAAVIWGYQNLLKLAGKDPQDAFPDGVWQHYVSYAMREDTARHANETVGFDQSLAQHNIRLSRLDRITAWVMAAIHTIHTYHDLLENEWRERVTLYTLCQHAADLPENSRYQRLYHEWEQQRPYARGADVQATETYAQYRRRRFDQFIQEHVRDLPSAVRQAWNETLGHAYAYDLPAYKRQMSILASLEPEQFNETIEPMALPHLHIGLIYDNRYYLIPACVPGSDTAADSTTVRAQVAAILHSPSAHPAAMLSHLTSVKRSALPSLVGKLSPEIQQELRTLRCAPIMLNVDLHDHTLPLTDVRLTERGAGNHALTLIDTGRSMIFDQSHIFFDGAWGSALAEIMTGEALSWAAYLHRVDEPEPAPIRPYSPVLRFSLDELAEITAAPQISAEAGAESTAVDLDAILALRRWLKKRNDLIKLTVNDILVLYRAIHAVTYVPDGKLVAAIGELAQNPDTAAIAEAITDSWVDLRSVSPAVLIPIDASLARPADRLHPMSFEIPLTELQIIEHHSGTLRALDRALQARDQRELAWEEFDTARRTYLAILAGVGEVLTKAKEWALQGESASSSAIRLLAHLPPSLQHILDAIPGKFDVLNDLIKGREVFSNVGAVVPTSSLQRFSTAKDDNDKKTLAWGVITDGSKTMHISLRDFRPHVWELSEMGRRDLAVWITRDYLDAYVRGLNRYIKELLRLTQTRRPAAEHF